jgi:hypothetical protein
MISRFKKLLDLNTELVGKGKRSLILATKKKMALPSALFKPCAEIEVRDGMAQHWQESAWTQRV